MRNALDARTRASENRVRKKTYRQASISSARPSVISSKIECTDNSFPPAAYANAGIAYPTRYIRTGFPVIHKRSGGKCTVIAEIASDRHRKSRPKSHV